MPLNRSSTSTREPLGVTRGVVHRFLEDQVEVAARVDAEPDVPRHVGRVKRHPVSPAANTSSACSRILLVRSSRRSRSGLIAQTMSLIAVTDSRATAAIDASCASAVVGRLTPHDLAQHRNPRQVRADVVVQVGRDARPHGAIFEEPRTRYRYHA